MKIEYSHQLLTKSPPSVNELQQAHRSNVKGKIERCCMDLKNGIIISDNHNNNNNDNRTVCDQTTFNEFLLRFCRHSRYSMCVAERVWNSYLSAWDKQNSVEMRAVVINTFLMMPKARFNHCTRAWGWLRKWKFCYCVCQLPRAYICIAPFSTCIVYASLSSIYTVASSTNINENKIRGNTV